MAAALDPGDQHAHYIDWARSRGIQTSGVAPARFGHRGMGIVAAQHLKKGDCIVHVPAQSLIHAALPDLRSRTGLSTNVHVTVHSQLALYLALHCLDSSSELKPWLSVWPTPSEFKAILPMHWPLRFQRLLPPAALSLLASQRHKLERDWHAISVHLPSAPASLSKDLYTYAWLIVSTRTFYWDYPDLPNSHPRLPKKRSQMTADDCYAMCPFMDYFNHSDIGCNPKRDKEGYSVSADRDYSKSFCFDHEEGRHVGDAASDMHAEAGEEVYVSYGSHTNDFLLVEYGFILGENIRDSLPLDHLITPQLSATQVSALKEDGYYGNYTLSAPVTVQPSKTLSTGDDADDKEANLAASPLVCHRTQAVLRLLVLPTRRYAAFVCGRDEGPADQGKVDSYLLSLLLKYSREVIEIVEQVTELVVETNATQDREARPLAKIEQRDMLLTRWKQIRDHVKRAIEELS